MTSLTTQPTFLQRILGSNYKWFYTVLYHFNRAQLTFFATFYFQLSLVVNTSAIAVLWFFINKEVVVYVLLGRVYADLCKSLSYNRLGHSVINGQISTELILPQPYLYLQLWIDFGSRIFRNLANSFSLVIFIACFWLFGYVQNIQGNFLLALVFLPISYFINFYIGIIFGSIAFYLEDTRDFDGLKESFETITNLFRGGIIPLTFFAFLLPMQWLPFAFTFYHPMQIYLGKYNFEQTLWVFVGGLIWCFVLYFLAKIVFKLGLKRNESVGL